MNTPGNTLQGLKRKALLLIEQCHQMERKYADQLADLHPDLLPSALNLIHYMALRQFDMRDFQQSLSQYGFSSLGRAEGHVMDAVLKVEHLISKLLQEPSLLEKQGEKDVLMGDGLLFRNTRELLGEAAPNREVRIMVTLPETAASDYGLVRKLLEAGMDCARVNCAHDNRGVWKRMIANVRKAAEEMGKDCRILMDLAGPKLRTGPIALDARVASWKPKKAKTGELLSPALLWLGYGKVPLPTHLALDAVIEVGDTWILDVRAGEVIHFRDRRAKPPYPRHRGPPRRHCGGGLGKCLH